MKESIRRALNEQIKLEYAAFHKYNAMSIWFDLHDLPGFTSWFQTQSADELSHATKIVAHLLERDQQPVLPSLDAPPTEWSSARDVIEDVLKAEQTVTAAVSALYDLTQQENDQAAQILMQWFVTEQVEEENVVNALLGRLKLVGDSGVGLLMIDQELGNGRVPGAAAPPAGGQ